MVVAAPQVPGFVASVSNVGRVEIGLLGVALLLVVLLLAVRFKRARDQKIRKAAATGYYDPDVARYGPGATSAPGTDPSGQWADGPIAPSFTSSPREVGEAMPGPSEIRSAAVPATPAIGSRPSSGPIPPFVPPVLPRPPGADPAGVADPGSSSTLPLLEQPPPPPERPSPPD
jgi:hypothetical protein